jgi:hypothetical protein
LLGWNNKILFPESLEWTIDWEKDFNSGKVARQLMAEQIDRFNSR